MVGFILERVDGVDMDDTGMTVCVLSEIPKRRKNKTMKSARKNYS